jgi:hypothetical protein
MTIDLHVKHNYSCHILIFSADFQKLHFTVQNLLQLPANEATTYHLTCVLLVPIFNEMLLCTYRHNHRHPGPQEHGSEVLFLTLAQIIL